MRHILLGALLISGCGDQESITVPQPVPHFLRQSIPGAHNSTTLLVGLPGAVDGVGKVHVRDPGSSNSVTVSSAQVGSFSAVIALGKDSELEVSFENRDGLSDWVVVPKVEATDGIGLSTPNSDGLGIVSPPDAQGQVTVTNNAGPAQPKLILATPDVDLIVSNTNNGSVVVSVTDSNGDFTVKLPGAVGDVIQILLVEPANSKVTSDFLSYKVPSS
jgi:hypothetical protein